MTDLKVGAHLSIAGGFQNAVTKIHEIGGNCLQIFSSSPRNWGVIPPSQAQLAVFSEYKKKFAINPIYFHASYLINLADSDRIGQISVKTLIDELHLARQLGIKGTIIHLGSFKLKDTVPTPDQYRILLKNIRTVLANTPDETLFIIENAGNKKLCWSLDEIAFLLKELKNSRVRVCLDTCHLWGAGYDLSTPELFNNFWNEFDTKVGFEHLELFQINDSKDPLGSFRDRHENIGKGTMPEQTFQLLVTDEKTKDKPFILEVPGFDKKGPDKQNIDILLSFSK